MNNTLKTGIRIKIGNSYKEIHFKTKKEAYTTIYIQKLLKQYHSTKENYQKISCLCTPLDQPKRYLSSKKIKNTYYLANFPSNEPHQIGCPFYQSNSDEELVDDAGKYSDKIFVEPENLYNKSIDNNAKEFLREKNTHRQHTYNNFCRDLVSESLVYAFNIANKDKNKKEDLTNLNIEQFYYAIWYIYHKKDTLLKGKIIANALPPKHKLEFGYIENDVFSKYNKDSKTYYIKAKKSISKNEFKTKYYNFTPKKFLIARKMITNYNNIITPPYFYIAIIKPKKMKDKYYNNIVRFFLHPIYHNDSIVFIESNIEREYAKKLLTQNIPFIKPFLGNEPYRIKKGIFCYTIDNKQKCFNLNSYRPDFIEFHKDKVMIVEVSGYKDKNYIKQLNEKINYYKREAKKHNNRYEIKKIDVLF